jgi:hypothetical protein
MRAHATAIVVAALAVAAGGCGGGQVSDSGDPAAMRMLAFAKHARRLADGTDRAALAFTREHADARETRRLLARLEGESARLRHDVERGVPIGTVARAAVAGSAKETATAAHFLGDYTSDREAFQLSHGRLHLAMAAGALRAARRVLTPRLGPGFAGELDRLGAPLAGVPQSAL